MHGPLFLAALGAAAQNEHFLALRRGAEAHLQAGMHLLPFLSQQLAFEALQHRLGRAHDIAPLFLFQILDVLCADHAAIQHPDTLRFAVTRFHGFDHLFQCGHIGTVASEDLVAQRHTTATDHQSDVHLSAIGPMIP